MIWRAVYFINGPRDGWSESLFHRTNVANPAQIGTELEFLLTKRAAFLGTPYRIVAYRLSTYSQDNGDKVTQRQKYFRRVDLGTPYPEPAEPGNVGVESLHFDATNVYETRATYGGPFDSAVVNGGVVNPAAGGFGALVDAFEAAVLDTPGTTTDWGWARVGVPTTAEVVSFDMAGATGIVTMALKADLPAPYVAPGRFPARISKVEKGRSALNGQVNVVVQGPRLVSTLTPIAFAGDPGGGILNLYVARRIYTQFGALRALQLASVKHRRGRPFGSSRGRRQVRPRA